MTERVDCAHCGKTGTCANGVDGCACDVCARSAFGKSYAEASSLKGLVCSVCEGRGFAENFSLKLQNRFLPFFAVGFLFLLLIFIMTSYFFSKNYKDVVAFAGPLVGTIIAFYFSAKNK